jgi:hypothetical protein
MISSGVGDFFLIMIQDGHAVHGQIPIAEHCSDIRNSACKKFPREAAVSRIAVDGDRTVL